MIIYKTTNLVNHKIYIGKDSNNNPDYLGSGLLLHRAINLHGIENFVKETLDTAKSIKELDEKEKYWIKKLNAQDRKIGYNIADGGNGGNTISGYTDDELLKFCENVSIGLNKLYESEKGNAVRKKISDSLLEYFSSNAWETKKAERDNFLNSDEGILWRKMLSESKIELYKTERGLEIKTQISESLINFYKSDEGITQRNHLSKLRKGKTYEDIMGIEKAKKVKNKKSAWMKENNPMQNIDFSGENNPFFGKSHNKEFCDEQTKRMKGNDFFKGKTHSEESKEKMRKRAKERDYSGKNNPMYGKSLYDKWREQYSPEEAEEKIKNHKLHLKNIANKRKLKNKQNGKNTQL